MEVDHRGDEQDDVDEGDAQQQGSAQAAQAEGVPCQKAEDQQYPEADLTSDDDSSFDLDKYVFGALRAGAAGFLLKNTEADALVQAVRLVARGDGLLSPSVTRRLINAFAQTSERKPYDPQALTPRERQVLACVARGLSNVEIAVELDMTEATAKTHVSRVLGKLGVRSRVQAAILYVEGE